MHKGSKTIVNPATTVNSMATNIKRVYHNDKTSTYWLPKDDEEQMRLTGQHYAFKSLYGGNVLPSVIDALDFQKGINILDVGCGSGIWVMDMVQEYPNCAYHGCDIDDITYKKIRVNQFTFSKGNVIKGLPYEDNTFDFVHMRFFVAALREENEWPTALGEVIRVTKPGGMIQVSDFDLKVPKDTTSLLYKAVLGYHHICKSRGQNPNIGAELETMLSKHSNIKIVQSDYRTCDMSSGTSTAKMFIWDSLEGVKSAKDVLGPMLGVNTPEELEDFLIRYRHDLETKESPVSFNSVAVQKLPVV
ncbi:S-adenosyl-L-methionine-dependent methyltransferase [Rhizopus microsporus var. microsporus]|nr:S-adenosyl-L-methionine-dependent methyltransferase [Rhizopus microsporus var. microsporus]